MVDGLHTGGDASTLRDYLRVGRRRWRLIATVMVLAVGASIAYSLLQPVQYLSTAEVLVEPTPADISTTGAAEVTPEEMATQVEVVTSLPVARLVQDRLALAEVPDLDTLVTAEVMGSSRIVQITATSSRPPQAATLANAVARGYLTYRGAESGRRFDQAAATLSARQRAVQDRIDAIDLALAERPRGRVQLRSERRDLLTQLGQIAAQVEAVDRSVSSGAASGTVLQAAEPAETPVSPTPVLNGVLAACVGLLFGGAAAVLRDRLDDVVHDEDTVRRALDRAPVLGRIPRWDDAANYGRLVTVLSPYSAAGEAYQTLSVNVRFLLATVRRPVNGAGVVMVTSAYAGEGKTVTAANLAVAAARVGMRVVLVDADLRRARVAERFGMPVDVRGLSDLLATDDAIEDSLIHVGVDRLRLLPAGTVPPNPTELLASARMRMVLQELAENADLVLLDTPPALLVADTLELAGAVDLTVIVARQGFSRYRGLTSVTERLRQVGAQSVGGVVNSVEASDEADFGYGYEPSRTDTAADETPPISSPTSA